MMSMLLTSTFRMSVRLVSVVEPDPRGLSVAFIAAAGAAEPWGAIHAAVNRRAWRRLGCEIDELDFARQSPRELVRRLRNADLIFVGGGNTFFLMQELRRTGAADAIVDRVHDGVPYVGESAGAVIAARDIGYIAPMDRRDKAPGLSDDRGLGLVDWSVVPHMRGPLLGRAASTIAARHVGDPRFVPITDRQAILVRDGRTTLVDGGRIHGGQVRIS